MHRIADNPYLKLMWSEQEPATALVAAPNRIVAQGPDGLSAIDTWSSLPAWTDAAGATGKMAVQGEVLYRSIYNGLEAYDLESGRLLWRTRSLDSGEARDVTADASNIFLTSQTNRFLVLEKNGRFARAANAAADWTPLSFEEAILLYSDAAGLHALNTATNEQEWGTRIPGIRTAVLSDKNIYLLAEPPSGSEAVYAVEKSSGKLLWRREEQGQVISNLCLLEPSIFYLVADGHLVVLSTLTGNPVARIAFTNTPFALKGQQASTGQYQLAADPSNEALAIAFGDSQQLIALKLLGGQEVFIEKPLYR